MARLHPTQSAGFNALLTQLHEDLSQLAKLYHKDVEAALKENEKLRVMLLDGSNSQVDNDQNGGTSPPSEASAPRWERDACGNIPLEPSAPLWEREAHGITPTAPPESVAQRQSNSSAKSVTLLKSVESDSSSSADFEAPSELVGRMSPTPELKKLGAKSLSKSLRQHYHMRSPWSDHREFNQMSLQEVLTEEVFELCQTVETRVEGLRVTRLESMHVEGNWSWLVVHPGSKARGYWILACMALLLYDFIMVPIDLCFDLGESPFSIAMDITAATFWTMDMVFTFFVGVRKAHSVEHDPAKIACLYFKSWFIFDMLLVVSEWVAVAIADDNFSGGQVSVIRLARWGRLMRLLRMARIVRTARLKPLLRHLVYVFNISKAYINLMHALAGLTFGLIMYTHIISCVWYALGNSLDDGWVSVNGLKSVSVARAYAASLHWSSSRLHGVQTYNTMELGSELFLDALLIGVSLILAAFYYGTVAAVAMTSANTRITNLWKLSALFVKRHRISAGLDMKMVRFLECSGIGGAMEKAAEELTLLESLPKTLQHDLLFEARVPFLKTKPYLNHLLAANSRMIRKICIEGITPKVYVDGEVVFANGDACHDMFFVTSGILYYILDNATESLGNIQDKLYNRLSMGPLLEDTSTRQLERKSSASEPALWTHWTHIGGLLSIEESTLLVLSSLEFSQVVTQHRDAFCYAFKYAKYFLWKLNHTPDDIDDLTAFHEITISDLDTNMFEGTEYDHFMFLSHYKVEAGTEATLMRDTFQDILREDPSHAANNLRSPIFVDSEDLTDLSKLKEHVIGSAALVLLLTPGVLSRPWCLVEIVTAVNHEVNIVPVDIQRPGSKYNYPDSQFYANILNGKFLDQAAVDLLEGEGISLLDVEKALRQVFLKIAVSFSPHKSKAVREAELHDILARSTPEQADTRIGPSSSKRDCKISTADDAGEEASLVQRSSLSL